MLRLTSDIVVSDFRFTGVHEVSITSSWDELTDTCELAFPRKVSWRGQPLATGPGPLLRRDQAVSVRLGYDDRLAEVFQGYISSVKADIPVRVICQDAAWLLKRSPLTLSYKSVTLNTLLRDILPSQVPFEAPDVSLGPFRITNATPAQVLDYLRTNYYLKAWLRAGKLYVGLAYVPSLQREHVIRFERNVVSHSLEFLRKEDVRIRLKAINVRADNSRFEVEVGEPTGEQRTIYFYDLPDADVKFLAEAEIERMRFEGYRGSLTTFLEPHVQHGDVVDLRSQAYPERDGRYFVKAVTTKFGMQGGRQELELDSKLP